MANVRGNDIEEFVTLFVIFVFIATPFSFFGQDNFSYFESYHTNELVNNSIPDNFAGMDFNQLETVPLAPFSIKGNLSFDYNGLVNLLITFKFNNETELSNYLSQLSDRSSPNYHKYITQQEFASKYSVSPSFYNEVANYLDSYAGVKIQKYSDRVSIGVTGPASTIDLIFRTTIGTQTKGGTIFFASTAPELPTTIAREVSSVSGFSNTPIATTPDYGLGSEKKFFSYNQSSSYLLNISGNQGIYSYARSPSYPQPISENGIQYVFGSDLQVAYQETTLLNITYPVNETIATILWSGNNSSGQSVGPYYPRDVYSYFNATLPSYEPLPHVHAVPINGAPQPGISSTYDVTSAAGENTLDLEMVGSTAPGSNIYNVYGPNSSSANLDEALAYILNPNSSFSALNNVSVISNSWGGTDGNDSSWYSYLIEAEARGITVLASSGDSGDNPYSSKFYGTSYPGDYTEFPSSMAYNSFGVTAVGGTTLTLNSTLQIENQTAWYIAVPSNDGPAGSTGGISQVFPEPSWQQNSEANKVIQGKGRGVPDLSAIANNTVTYETVNGTNYYYFNTGTFYYDWGTSVASPVVAGIVAEINAVMNHYGETDVGYLNPLLYELGNLSVKHFTNTSTTGFVTQGNYNSTLPMLPFYDVTQGGNYVNEALSGYDLVTGWGSLNAYNFTSYILNLSFTGTLGAAEGVQNAFNLSALSVTSYYSNGTVDEYYNASIQQNFFLANELGAPIYWIQNVIYISYYINNTFAMNYTGWVVFPFYGQYPSATVYEYNFPNGKNVTLPHSFDIKSWLVPSPGEFNGQVLYFEVNNQTISLPVPGAAYIIDALNYSYDWNGHTFVNGPYPSEYNASIGLVPQFGLVGGPSLSTGAFLSPTEGMLKSYVQAFGTGNYYAANSKAFYQSGDQTGELAQNLLWSNNSGTWTLSISNGSGQQGIAFYQNISQALKKYNVTFRESGLPAGEWYVNLTNGQSFSSSSGNVTFYEPNGSYSYYISSANKQYRPSNYEGSFNVSGTNQSITITFSTVTFNVTFLESGLTSGVRWSVTLNRSSKNSTSDSITFSEPNGSYVYSVTNISGYSSSNVSGTISVNGKSVSISTIFTSTRHFNVTVKETGLPSGVKWYLNASNGQTINSSSSTISFSELNGSYTFSIYSGNKKYSPLPLSLSLIVNGSAVSKNVTFMLVTYVLTFTELGLSTGSAWTVIMNETSHSTRSTSISFSLPNGTYDFSVDNVSGYGIYPSSGQIVINGKPVEKQIIFTFTVKDGYLVGSITPSNATVWINGEAYVTKNGSFNISLPPGIYEVKMTAPGYSSYVTNVTISSSSVTLLPTHSLTKFNKPMPNLHFLISVIVVVLVIAIVLGVFRGVINSKNRKM